MDSVGAGSYPTAPGSPAQLAPGSPIDETRNNRISFTGSVNASPSIPFGMPPGSPRSSVFSPTSSTGSRDVKDLQNDVIVKILLLGDSGTGKSQLFHRLRTQKFNPIPLPTPGIDVTTHRIKIADGSTMKAQIFDTSGLDRYRSIVQNYWNLAHGAMVVYDVNSRESFTNMRRWVRDFKAKLGQQPKRPESPQTSNSGTASDSESKERKGPLIMIIGNKTDVGESTREVSTADGSAYAAAHGFIFMETSAKDDQNVELAFNVLLTEAYHNEKDRLDAAKLRIAEEERKNDEGAAGLVGLIRKLSERRPLRGDSGKDVREKRYSTSPPPRGTRSSSIGASESRESSLTDDNTSASIILGNGMLVPPRKASLLPALDDGSNVTVRFLESLDAGAKTLWNWVGEVATAIADETRDVHAILFLPSCGLNQLSRKLRKLGKCQLSSTSVRLLSITQA